MVVGTSESSHDNPKPGGRDNTRSVNVFGNLKSCLDDRYSSAGHTF